MLKNFFSPPPKGLSLEDALELSNNLLENARKLKNTPAKALQLCNEAELRIKDAKKIFATGRAADPALHNGIANAYHEHGKLLDELGYHSKAQRSHSKAGEWGYVSLFGSAQSGNTSGAIRRTLSPPAAFSEATSTTTAPANQNFSSSDITQPPPQHLIQNETLSETNNLISEAREHLCQVPIFDQEVALPGVKFALPEVGGRITSTPQLAYCLALLRNSSILMDELDNIEYEWLRARINDPDEQERLQTMSTNLVRAFVRDELKKPDVVTEVVCLSAVLDRDDFRALLREFVDCIEKSVLLKVHLLDGLAQLVGNTASGYVDADDLVKILGLLDRRLKGTHQQSTQHIYRLTQAVSRVLDSMVESQVKGLMRDQLHAPLSNYLKELQHSSDSFLVYQAAYAYQALQYVPDDETILQAAVRRTGKVLQGISGVVSVVKTLDLNRFVQGLQNIQEGLSGTGKAIVLVNDAYQHARALAESGQGFLECLNEGFGSIGKSTWYPALKGLDTLLQAGRLAEFEKLIREAPCRQDPTFQWGVCQRLGEIAANSVCDTHVRKSAVAFLGELYTDDARWGQQADIKQWILHILKKLVEFTESAESTVASDIRELLQELKANGDAMEQALFQVCDVDIPSPYPLLVAQPSPASHLLDIVQNKVDVEAKISQLKRERLRERGVDIYISPRAKATLRAKEDFDLTSKVQEFLSSERQVFLLLGDSGAGKSTFNRALEISLWDTYEKTNGRIPLFIYLPTIDKPEYDLVTKQLHKVGFTEEQIRELKAHHEFILICDGYDESQQSRNLYRSNQLNQSGGWRAQMVISCRTEYTGVDYRDRFEPTNRRSGGQLDLFQEAVIAPFNKDQINDYVDRYVLSSKRSWESEDYQRALKEIPNLQDLVKNPFLLKLALEVLPQLVDKGSNFSKTLITRIGLYDEFVAQWLERGKIRLMDVELSEDDKEAFKNLCLFGFNQQATAFLKDFAAAVYDNQGGNPVVSYSESQDRRTWKEEFFDRKDGKNLLLEAMPFICSGIQYRFIHRSVLEYGLTLAVFDPKEHEVKTIHERHKPTSVPTRRGSTSSSYSFEASLFTEKTELASEQRLLDSPLGRKNFVGESSIRLFLVERAQQQQIFKDQLHAIIQRSKTDKTARVGAANAITVLVQAGVQFIGADLRGIKIPGADLSYGMFDSGHLEGADLRKANLRNAWLRQVDFSGAQMTGVQFGELPYLKEEDEVVKCAYSSDGKVCAAAMRRGDISVYDTSNWRKIWTLKGHKGEVYCLEFSAMSNWLASGGDDGKVMLWDTETGSCIHTLQDHRSVVCSIAYSSTGNLIVSGSYDATMRLWDVETGNCIRTFEGHKGSVRCVAYSPKGDQVASGGNDKTVRLWNVETGDCIHILQGHGNYINCITYSPKGNRIATGAGGQAVMLWDTENGDNLHALGSHGGHVIVFSPKGDLLASTGDETARLWDVETGKCVQTLEGHNSRISSMLYSPKGDIVATGSWDNTVRLWDVETGDCVHHLQGHSYIVGTIAFSPKGDQIASGSLDHTVRLWNTKTGNFIHTIQGHSNKVTGVASSLKGDRIVSGSYDKTVRLWDVETGDCVYNLQDHTMVVTAVAYSPNGDRIASGSDDKTVKLWDPETGACIHTLQGHKICVDRVVFSPDGSQIAAAKTRDSRVWLWDVKTGILLDTLKGHTNYVTCLMYSPKGYQIASGSNDSTVMLWDAKTGRSIYTFEGHGGVVHTVAYSPKGDQVASGSRDKTVRLWDVETGKRVKTLKGHSDTVTVVTYSPKGGQIASGSADKTVQLWESKTGNCIQVLQGHKKSIASVVYSPNASRIASGSEDGAVRIWDIRTGSCLVTISGFHGTVGFVAWENTASNDQYLVTGSSDKAIRRWKIFMERFEYKAILCWSSSHGVLTASDASFNNVEGLSDVDRMLLNQHGASMKSTVPKSGTGFQFAFDPKSFSNAKGSGEADRTLSGQHGFLMDSTALKSETSFQFAFNPTPFNNFNDPSEADRTPSSQRGASIKLSAPQIESGFQFAFDPKTFSNVQGSNEVDKTLSGQLGSSVKSIAPKSESNFQFSFDSTSFSSVKGSSEADKTASIQHEDSAKPSASKTETNFQFAFDFTSFGNSMQGSK